MAGRRFLEETGISVAITDLVGIWTDPRHRIEYTSDGEVRQEFTVIYAGRYVSGEPTPSKESLSVEWVDPRRCRAFRWTAANASGSTGR